MKSTTAFTKSVSRPASPALRLALDRARIVFEQCAARTAVGAKRIYEITTERLAAKRQIARESGLAVEGRVTLGPKKSLVLVHCHGRRYLIASAGDTVAPIVEVLPVDVLPVASTPRKRAPRAQEPERAQ